MYVYMYMYIYIYIYIYNHKQNSRRVTLDTKTTVHLEASRFGFALVAQCYNVFVVSCPAAPPPAPPTPSSV